MQSALLVVQNDKLAIGGFPSKTSHFGLEMDFCLRNGYSLSKRPNN